MGYTVVYKVDTLDGRYILYSSLNGQVHLGIALARITSIHLVSEEEGGEVVPWQGYTRQLTELVLGGKISTIPCLRSNKCAETFTLLC